MDKKMNSVMQRLRKLELATKQDKEEIKKLKTTVEALRGLREEEVRASEALHEQLKKNGEQFEKLDERSKDLARLWDEFTEELQLGDQGRNHKQRAVDNGPVVAGTSSQQEQQGQQKAAEAAKKESDKRADEAKAKKVADAAQLVDKEQKPAEATKKAEEVKAKKVEDTAKVKAAKVQADKEQKATKAAKKAATAKMETAGKADKIKKDAATKADNHNKADEAKKSKKKPPKAFAETSAKRLPMGNGGVAPGEPRPKILKETAGTTGIGDGHNVPDWSAVPCKGGPGMRLYPMSQKGWIAVSINRNEVIPIDHKAAAALTKKLCVKFSVDREISTVVEEGVCKVAVALAQDILGRLIDPIRDRIPLFTLGTNVRSGEANKYKTITDFFKAQPEPTKSITCCTLKVLEYNKFPAVTQWAMAKAVVDMCADNFGELLDGEPPYVDVE